MPTKGNQVEFIGNFYFALFHQLKKNFNNTMNDITQSASNPQAPDVHHASGVI